MKFHRLSRRHFLQGLGGASLALPLLPSLMNRAEAQGMTAPRFFVSTWVGHGGISEENAYPIDSTVSLSDQTLTPASGSEGAHVAKVGRLVELKRTHPATAAARVQVLTDFDAGAARFSPLLGAFVEDPLLAKLNVLRGIDFLTFGGHTRGYLGNFVNRDGGADNGMADLQIPTIDAVIAGSPKFYSQGERALLKAPVLNAASPHLSSFTSGATVANNPYRVSRLGEFYDLLFGGVNTTPGQQPDPRVSLLDRVHQDYRRLSRGAFGPGRRISTEDRQRLEEYVAGVQTISDRMRAMVSAGCSLPTVAQGQRTLYLREGEADWDWDSAATMPQQRVADQRTVLELRNQMLVNAFLCGTSRMAVMSFASIRDQWDPAIFNTPSQWETQRTDAHGMLFHNHGLADRQQHLLSSQRFFMQYGFIDLVRRMQSTQVLPGVTMLDQALVYWSSESGFATHNAKSVPAIIAGGGGGYFQTGNYVDYTNRTRSIRGRWGDQWTAGIPQNRLLANIAQAMGLSPSDYELSDAAYSTKFASRGGRVPGYGDPFIEPGDDKVPYPPAMVAAMSEKLPLL
ncbi:MAG: inositol monophosphatase family protein [Archangium sp.]|nr:inositol monophosphatase family protein [Archangium sp.]